MVARLEKRDSRAQKRDSVLRFMEGRAELFRRQGYVVRTWRHYGGRKLGPYHRLRYRDGGRQRSVYLGRDAELAEAVKAQLRQLQAPLREHRQNQRFWKCCHDHLRQLKAAADRELRRVGLHYHGNEIRGWRTANFEERYAQVLQSEKRQTGAQKTTPRADEHRGPPEWNDGYEWR